MLVSNKTIAFNVFGLLLIKAISMTVSLATIPALLAYFGGDKEVLGIWLTFFTFVTIAISLDLGVGNRLKNDILSRASRGEEYSDLVADSFGAQFFVAMLVVTLGLGGGLVFWCLQGDSAEIGRIFIKSPELLVCAIGFILISMPLRLSCFILQAQQKNAISSFVFLVPQLAVLFYAVVSIRTTFLALTLPALAAVMLVATLAAYSVSFWVVCRGWSPFAVLLNHKKHFGMLVKTQVNKLKPGLPFFFVQVSIIFLYGSNELYYFAVGNVVDVVSYQYYFRPLSLFSVGFSIISLPFWSAIRLSQLQQNTRRTRYLMAAIILMNFVVIIALVPTAIFFQYFVDVWLGVGVYVVEDSLLVVFVVSTLLTCIMHALSSILSGYDLIAFQAGALGGGVVVKVLVLAALVVSETTADSVMISTVVGLLLVVIAFSLKTCTVWRSNKTNMDRVL